MADELCSTCNKFDIQSFSRDPLLWRGYKYSTTLASSRQGCSFCRTLCRALENAEWEVEDIFGRKTRGVNPPSGWENSYWIHLTLQCHKQPQGDHTESLGLEAYSLVVLLGKEHLSASEKRSILSTPTTKIVRFHLVSDKDSPAAQNRDVLPVFPPAPGITEPFSIEIVKDWLHRCESHEHCGRSISGASLAPRDARPLPSRCIEKVNDTYFLRETAGQYGSYIALSHRWTSATEACRLLKVNYDARKAGDQFENMPQLFRDAIDVAEQLGIRYVWIDSLCIIQDDVGMLDWSTESVKMAEYYQLASLTVFGTSGSEEHGLFPPQVEQMPKLVRLPYRDKQARPRGWFYLYEYNSQVNDSFQKHVVESGLFTRGWVYQEWLFSRRAVCYTPNGLFFSCVSVNPVNGHGDQVDRREYDYTLPLSLKSFFFFEGNSLRSIWYRVVEGYSPLQFTYPEKDRVVALLGIAEELRSAFGRHDIESTRHNGHLGKSLLCIAGLWLRDIYFGLLWQQREAARDGCDTVAHMPTWSWTSILTPVYWPDRPYRRPACRLEGLKTSRTSSDVVVLDDDGRITGAFGGLNLQTSFACLVFRGRLHDVIIRDAFHFDTDIRVVAGVTGHHLGGFEYENQPTSSREHTGRRSWRKVYSPLDPDRVAGWGSFEHADFSHDDSFPAAAGQLFAFRVSVTCNLPCGYQVGQGVGYNDAYNMIFLRHVGGQQYERIGVGGLYGRESQKQWDMAAEQIVELI